ncbi:MAG: hypothetical protein ABI172_07250 [Ginsengibacter sp.]
MNHEKLLTINKKDLINLNIFWLGFIIYSICFTLSSSNNANYKVIQSGQILGLIFIFYTIVNLIQYKFDNQYLKIVFSLYCAWLFTVILRGFILDYSFLKDFLFNPDVGMLYFSPLILLFPRNLIFLKRVFDVIIIFGIFYLIFDVLFVKDLLSSDRSNMTGQGMVEFFSILSFPSGFLILTYAYHSKPKQILAIFVLFFAILFAIVRARRGLILMYSSLFLFSYVVFIVTAKRKILALYLTSLLLLLGIFYFSKIYKFNESPIFGYISDRGSEDTRTGIELYFYNDMKTKDWILGRGINGEYFCPNVEENQVTNYRNGIETGYLQTILKGGIISLGLFLLIAIPAIIRGLFNSKNLLSKAAAIWILMSILNSYPAVINSFSLNYLIVWISIGICYSKEIRMLSDNNLKEQLQSQKIFKNSILKQ